MLHKANVLITGLPGCGKSTLITRIVDSLRVHGYKVGGITTPDFRSQTGKRRGFLIRDIATSDEQVMASFSIHSNVRVGRYSVDVEAIQSLGVSAINRAIDAADIVVIDEIGKMELVVPEFRQSVIRALDCPKPVLGTIGLHLKSDFVSTVKLRSDVTVERLTRGLHTALHKRVCALLGISDLEI